MYVIKSKAELVSEIYQSIYWFKKNIDANLSSNVATNVQHMLWLVLYSLVPALADLIQAQPDLLILIHLGYV